MMKIYIHRPDMGWRRGITPDTLLDPFKKKTLAEIKTEKNLCIEKLKSQMESQQKNMLEVPQHKI